MADDNSKGFSNQSSEHRKVYSPESNSDSRDFVRHGTSKEVKPDLVFENVNYNASSGDQVNNDVERKPITPMENPPRKEDNPFSFKHFLKRDLSLPGSTSYENTGAKPKVYSSTVQHSPLKSDYSPLSRRKPENVTKEKKTQRVSNGSSVDILVGNNESLRLYPKNIAPLYKRANGPADPPAMPALPDFVQDHILVEQAYLNSNSSLNLDLDNLPDFTFTTGYNQAPKSPTQEHTDRRGYGYHLNQQNSSNGPVDCNSVRPILDLGGDEQEEASGVSGNGRPPLPLDLANHFNLDLTESVNPADRRNVTQRSFPLNFPSNATGNTNQPGSESLRLPDFLPVYSGNRQSPEQEENQNPEVERLQTQLELMSSQLSSERQRSTQLERDLSAARTVEDILREELKKIRMTERDLRGQLQRVRHSNDLPSVSHGGAEEGQQNEEWKKSETDNTIASLKSHIKQLKVELREARRMCEERGMRQQQAARSLADATNTAELSLRDLLTGLDALRGLCSTLDPPDSFEN